MLRLPKVRRARVCGSPPVIQHARNMMDPIGLLDDAKKQIVILSAVEFRTKAAHVLDKLASNRGEVTDVIVGKKKIGRPIGLKDRRLAAILSQFVFIRENQIGVGMVLHVSSRQ